MSNTHTIKNAASPLTRSLVQSLPGREWMGWPWLAVVALGVTDAIWLTATSLSLKPSSWPSQAGIAITALICAAISKKFSHSERVSVFFGGAAIMLAGWPVLRLFNHLTMANSFPLADPWLSSLDQIIGFDWFAYLLWVDRSVVLQSLMDRTYVGLDYYVAGLFLVLALQQGARRRCAELIRLFLMTAIACMSMGAFFPAVAAMQFYAPAESLLQRFSHKTGAYHMEAMMALRNDPNHVLDFDQLPGLVTFPSFHTAMGVIAIYCARGSLPLFLMMLAVNLMMIASTPVFGSHYAIDVIAGAAVAFCMIAAHRRIFSKMPKALKMPQLAATGEPVAVTS